MYAIISLHDGFSTYGAALATDNSVDFERFDDITETFVIFNSGVFVSVRDAPAIFALPARYFGC